MTAIFVVVMVYVYDQIMSVTEVMTVMTDQMKLAVVSNKHVDLKGMYTPYVIGPAKMDQVGT